MVIKEWLLLPLMKTENSEILNRGSNSRSGFDVSAHLERDIKMKSSSESLVLGVYLEVLRM